VGVVTEATSKKLAWLENRSKKPQPFWKRGEKRKRKKTSIPFYFTKRSK